MSKIQIHEISPMETPMKDLSEDMTNSIQGAGLLEDVQQLINDVFDNVEQILQDILFDIFGPQA